jgi:hypothetical protein
LSERPSIAWLTFLFEGAVIAFAAWELYKLRRDKRREAERRATSEDAAARPDGEDASR